MVPIQKQYNWSCLLKVFNSWQEAILEPVEKVNLFHPPRFTSGIECSWWTMTVHVEYKYFPLYTIIGGNLLPAADPHPLTVIISLPEPPPVSCTHLDPLRARTTVDATTVAIPVSSQFHSSASQLFIISNTQVTHQASQPS